MAIVVVQVGQCGNQLGEELWRQLLFATNNGTLSSPFFTRDGKARCVLVDSEPKVVRGVCERYGHVFRVENIIHGQSGRGNHWALGYYGVNDPLSKRSAEKASAPRPFLVSKDQRISDSSVAGEALRAMHMETRRTADALEFEAIIVLHSLVGGTGSGMASWLLEKIRYYFIDPPDGEAVDERREAEMMRRDGMDGVMAEKRRAAHLVSIAVAPQTAGELSTQGLNAALTLHALQRCADAVLLLRNDDCLGAQDGGGHPAAPAPLRRCATFREVNEIFVTLLMPILLYGRGTNAVGELITKCSPNHTAMNNILTLVPTPQRQYGRYTHTVLLSRHYLVSGAYTPLPGAKPFVPLDVLHTRHSLPAATAELAASAVEVRIPPTLLHAVTSAPGSRRTPAVALLLQMEGVLVINAARELNAAVIFPLLRSAAVKVRAGAFLTTFADLGLTAECITAAIREVAERLADAEDS